MLLGGSEKNRNNNVEKKPGKMTKNFYMDILDQQDLINFSQDLKNSLLNFLLGRQDKGMDDTELRIISI